jgi:hypothetical protein
VKVDRASLQVVPAASKGRVVLVVAAGSDTGCGLVAPAGMGGGLDFDRASDEGPISLPFALLV